MLFFISSSDFFLWTSNRPLLAFCFWCCDRATGFFSVIVQLFQCTLIYYSDGSEVERARSSADPSQRQTNGSSPFRNPGSRNHHQQQKRVGSGFRGRGTRGAAVQQHRHRSNPAQNWRHSRTAAFPGRARFMGHRMGSVAPRPMAGFGRFPRAVPNTAQFRPQPVMGPPVPLRPAMHWNMKGPVEGAQWSRAEARGQLLACQQPPNLEGAAGGGVEGVSYSLPPSDLQTAGELSSSINRVVYSEFLCWQHGGSRSRRRGVCVCACVLFWQLSLSYTVSCRLLSRAEGVSQ